MEYLYYLFLAVYIGLHAFDGWSTYTLIKMGYTEANPVMKKLFDSVGVLSGILLSKGLVLSATLYLLFWLHQTSSFFGFIILAICLLLYLYIGYNNYSIYKKHKNK